MLNNLVSFLQNKKQIYKESIIIFLIILLFSKEIIINDFEIVIIYSLIIALVFMYFNLRTAANQMFLKLINNIKEEYKILSYILITIEKNIIKILSSFNLIYYLKKKIFLLTYKYLIIINKYLNLNIIESNSILMNLSSLKQKINIFNKKKNSVFVLSKTNNLIFFESNKNYLNNNKNSINCD